MFLVGCCFRNFSFRKGANSGGRVWLLGLCSGEEALFQNGESFFLINSRENKVLETR